MNGNSGYPLFRSGRNGLDVQLARFCKIRFKRDLHMQSHDIFFSGIFEYNFPYDGNMILLHGKIHNRDVYNLDFEIHGLKS